jgi:hypothetical protein
MSELLPKNDADLELYMVYRTIELNPNITLNQLKFLLSKNCVFSQGKTAVLVKTLLESGCLGTFVRLAQKDKVHLNVKNVQADSLRQWCSIMASQNPTLYVPVYKRKTT